MSYSNPVILIFVKLLVVKSFQSVLRCDSAGRQVLSDTAVSAAGEKGPALTVDGFPIQISNTQRNTSKALSTSARLRIIVCRCAVDRHKQQIGPS